MFFKLCLGTGLSEIADNTITDWWRKQTQVITQQRLRGTSCTEQESRNDVRVELDINISVKGIDQKAKCTHVLSSSLSTKCLKPAYKDLLDLRCCVRWSAHTLQEFFGWPSESKSVPAVIHNKHACTCIHLVQKQTKVLSKSRPRGCDLIAPAFASLACPIQWIKLRVWCTKQHRYMVSTSD